MAWGTFFIHLRICEKLTFISAHFPDLDSLKELARREKISIGPGCGLTITNVHRIEDPGNTPGECLHSRGISHGSRLVLVQDGHEVMDTGVGSLCDRVLQHGDLVHDAGIQLGMEFSGTIGLLPTGSRLLVLV